MTRVIRYMMAAIILLLAVSSCTKEYYYSHHGCQVNLVADLGSINTRAIADGQTVNEVAWAVYKHGSSTPLDDMWGTMPISGKQAELSVRLVTGREYDLIFFAYYTENPVTEITYNGTINPMFYNIDLYNQSLTVEYNGATANDERRDCFWHAEQGLTVSGPISKTFTLKRPLAQLNFGVDIHDIELANEAGYQISDTAIKVDSYTELNLMDGSLSEKEPVTIYFNKAQTPVYNDDILTIANSNKEYKYLATTYVLVGSKCTSDISLDIYDNTDYLINTFTYSFVPLQRNYRTNIIGSLLTNPHIFTIVVDNNFTDDHNEF